MCIHQASIQSSTLYLYQFLISLTNQLCINPLVDSNAYNHRSHCVILFAYINQIYQSICPIKSPTVSSNIIDLQPDYGIIESVTRDYVYQIRIQLISHKRPCVSNQLLSHKRPCVSNQNLVNQSQETMCIKSVTQSQETMCIKSEFSHKRPCVSNHNLMSHNAV